MIDENNLTDIVGTNEHFFKFFFLYVVKTMFWLAYSLALIRCIIHKKKNANFLWRTKYQQKMISIKSTGPIHSSGARGFKISKQFQVITKQRKVCSVKNHTSLTYTSDWKADICYLFQFLHSSFCQMMFLVSYQDFISGCSNVCYSPSRYGLPHWIFPPLRISVSQVWL